MTGATPEPGVSDYVSFAAEPAPSEAIESALEFLDRESERPFHRTHSAPAVTGGTGSEGLSRLVRLHGGRWRSSHADPSAAAMEFLAKHGPLLGFDPANGWQLTPRVLRDGALVMFECSAAGVPIEGARIGVTLDGKVVTAAVSRLPQATTTALPTFRIGEATAIAAARARRASGATIPNGAMSTPDAERRFVLVQGALVPAYRVSERSADGTIAIDTIVDAESGKILATENLVLEGGPKYPYNGSLVPFKTGPAIGGVYANLGDALANKPKNVELKVEQGIPAPVNVAKGRLIGAHADVWDAGGQPVLEPGQKFIYGPFGNDADAFDQTNVFYQIEKTRNHLKHQIGSLLTPNASLPVLVNVPSATLGGSYSAATFPVDGHTAGYLTFFDASATLGPAGDSSRDPTLVSHEYIHAWLALEHQEFTGNQDDPSRAIGEGLADFFALSCQGGSVMNGYLENVSPGSGFLRDLASDQRFPYTTAAAMEFNPSHLPEEHQNGEIFGAMLLDLRRALGTAATEQLVFRALPIMPHALSDVGILAVTPDDAFTATDLFFGECARALLIASKDAKEAGAVLGAACARGLMNGTLNSQQILLELEQVPAKKFVLQSTVVAPGVVQEFLFSAIEGGVLSIKAKTASNSDLQPDVEVFAADGSNVGVATPQAKIFKKDGRSVTLNGVQLGIPGVGLYRVRVRGTGSTTGDYSLTLDLKSGSSQSQTDLVVQPLDPFVASGPAGGPFETSGGVYQIMNVGSDPIVWSLSSHPSWVVADVAGGVLNSGDFATVTLGVDPTATTGLVVGAYDSMVSFANLSAPGAPEIASLDSYLAILATPQGTLDITSPGLVQSAGPVGGPFSPSSMSFTVANNGTAPLNWKAATVATWLSLSSFGGQLDPGQSVNVSASLVTSGPNAAGLLPIGSYTGTIDFTNLSNGIGDASYDFDLDVTPSPSATLNVTGAAPLAMGGPIGGPFGAVTAGAQNYTVANTGTATLNWQANGTPSWLVVSPSSGQLQPGGSQNVVVSVAGSGNANPALFAAGSYSGQLTFTNLSGGGGDSAVTVVLAVSWTGVPQPLLHPGTGFSGATPQPPAIGSGTGSDATAIARWDVIPYQTMKSDFEVGVVAFHIAGIDRVDFCANGGAWYSSTQMSLNPRTKVWEYYGILPSSEFPTDGLVEIRAIAYPVVGIPRVLPSMYVYSNVHGTYAEVEKFVSTAGNDTTGDGTQSKPWHSINKAISAVGDGGTITIIGAGEYPVSSQSQTLVNSRWLTIRSGAGLTSSDVSIVPASGMTEVRPKVHRVRWQGVGFDFSKMYQVYPEPTDDIWFDQARFFDSAGWTHQMLMQPVRSTDAVAGVYATGSTATNMLYGFIDFTLVRDCTMNKLSGDALSSTRLVVNTSVTELSNLVIPSFHSDLCQHFGTWENFIMYGVKGTNLIGIQSIFDDHTSSTFKDCAFVNFLADNNSGNPPFSQLCSPHDHVLFINVTLLGQLMDMRDDLAAPETFTAKNVLFENCLMYRLSHSAGPGLPSGVTVKTSHFITGELHGQSPTSGAVTFVNGAGGAFGYSGAGASQLVASGTSVPKFLDPNLWNASATKPNRGAFTYDHP